MPSSNISVFLQPPIRQLISLIGAVLFGCTLARQAGAQSLFLPPSPSQAPLLLPPAFHHLLSDTSYTHVSVGMQAFEGPFRRPQAPESGTQAYFSAEGMQKVNRLIWTGQFAYGHQRDQGQLWNNTSRTADALPYLWADNATGTWGRNHFSARAQLASSVPNRGWQWGVETGFEGGQGSRFNDPRPLYRFRQAEIAPQIAWKMGSTNWLALALHAASFSEDNEMGFFSIADVLLFRIRGYGTFSRSPFVSGERLLTEERLGGTLHWHNGRGQYLRLSVSNAWGRSQEGVAIVTPAGAWDRQMLSLFWNWQNTKGRQLGVQGSFRALNGQDPIFLAINTRLNQIDAHIFANLEQNTSAGYTWQFWVQAGVEQRSQRDIAAFTELNTLHLPAGFSATFYGRPEKKVVPFAGISAHWQPNLSAALIADTPTLLTELLVRPDFAVLSASTLRTGLQAGADWQAAKGFFRLMLRASRLQPLGPAEGFHHHFQLSVSYLRASPRQLRQIFFQQL